MSDTNPFGGGFDMNALLEQAQAVQQQMVAAQEQLAAAEIDGTVGDGLVTVTVNGAGEMLRVRIKADSFDPADPEDLEDLIVAAYRDARAQADAAAAEALGPLAGGLGGLGGGLGGPGDGLGSPAGPGAGIEQGPSATGSAGDAGGETGGRPTLGF